MTLDELLAKLQEIKSDDPEAGNYEVYFMHGMRTYRVNRIAFDPAEDVDITLMGRWLNPQ